MMSRANLELPRVLKSKLEKILNFILHNIGKQMVPCKSTAEKVSFEWSHHCISSTDSKGITVTCLHN